MDMERRRCLYGIWILAGIAGGSAIVSIAERAGLLSPYNVTYVKDNPSGLRGVIYQRKDGEPIVAPGTSEEICNRGKEFLDHKGDVCLTDTKGKRVCGDAEGAEKDWNVTDYSNSTKRVTIYCKNAISAEKLPAPPLPIVQP